MKFFLLNFQTLSATSFVSAVMAGVPESVFRISEALKQNGLQKISFDDPSPHNEFIALRNALDTGKPANLCNFFAIFRYLKFLFINIYLLLKTGTLNW